MSADFIVVCDSEKAYCGKRITISGVERVETGSIELDMTDERWAEACEHIDNGDYIIRHAELEA